MLFDPEYTRLLADEEQIEKEARERRALESALQTSKKDAYRHVLNQINGMSEYGVSDRAIVNVIREICKELSQ